MTDNELPKLISKPDHAVALAEMLSSAYEPTLLNEATKFDIKAAVRLLENHKFLNLIEEVIGSLPSSSRQTRTPNPTQAKAFSRAKAIGEELAAIEVALSQGETAFSNKRWGDNTYSRHQYWDSPLFQALSSRREHLRNELLEIYP